jgi:hypothetical protein
LEKGDPVSTKRLVLLGAFALGAASPSSSPLRVFNEKSSVITFVNPADASRYIGYRIVEGDPIMTAAPVKGYEAMPERSGTYPPPPPPAETFPEADIPRGPYSTTWSSSYKDDRGFSFRAGPDGTAYFRYVEPHGTRVAVFKPVADGLDTWMWLEPAKAIPGSFLVEQCLRMSGAGNTEKRRRQSFVPELSEYDHWDRGDMRGLSFVRPGDSWRRVEPVLNYAKQSDIKQAWEYISKFGQGNVFPKSDFPTPAGFTVAEVGNGVAADRRIPSGLIVRESADGKTVAGMYWERSARVSTHYPADCLHALVDLGPAGGSRPQVVRGKVYWLKGTKDDLLARWKKDFPS